MPKKNFFRSGISLLGQNQEPGERFK